MTAVLTAVPVRFRALANGEVAPILDVFDGMSPRSRALRFLAPTPRLTAGMLRLLSDVDQERHLATVAEVDGRAVGLGSYVRHAHDPATADMALAVVDRHHRQGIGRSLLRVLMARAGCHGVTGFAVTVDPHNSAALALLRGVGADAWYADGVVEARVPVGAPGYPSAATWS
jgi:GNAT superfamily N-acetyltransferase